MVLQMKSSPRLPSRESSTVKSSLDLLVSLGGDSSENTDTLTGRVGWSPTDDSHRHDSTELGVREGPYW